MYSNVWNKYLPIIRILLKKALSSGDQVLDLNIPDFERAGIARKSGYKFLIKFSKGRVDNVIIASPLASSLSSTLLQDPVIKELFTNNEYHISLNPKFQLTIKTIPPSAQEMEVSENGNKEKH